MSTQFWDRLWRSAGIQFVILFIIAYFIYGDQPKDIRVEPWRDGLLERGLPVHLVNHLATMADLHRAGRFNRMMDERGA